MIVIVEQGSIGHTFGARFGGVLVIGVLGVGLIRNGGRPPLDDHHPRRGVGTVVVALGVAGEGALVFGVIGVVGLSILASAVNGADTRHECRNFEKGDN